MVRPGAALAPLRLDRGSRNATSRGRDAEVRGQRHRRGPTDNTSHSSVARSVAAGVPAVGMRALGRSATSEVEVGIDNVDRSA